MQPYLPKPKATAAPKKAAAYGMGAARGAKINARLGVVPGRVMIARQATETLTSKDPILQTSAFTQADQDLLGGSRSLSSAIGAVIVSGQLPTGYTAKSLAKIVAENLNVEILVQGQLRDSIPFSAFQDTRKTQRQIKMLLDFDPGAWGAVAFRFTTLGVRIPEPAPLPPGGIYQVKMQIKCAFDPSKG